ncbi:MAG: Asp-tRNA(Asn)/Glu-tRNA(Gln) amidotransferase subunit GatC [Janthinobacterium lividum]
MSHSIADPNASTAEPGIATVTLEDVRHVAALANLQLLADEEPRMQRDLNAILGHIAALSNVDTTGVPPMAQVSELLNAAPAPAGANLRQDEPRTSVDRAAVMHEAPETDGRFFKVPKVIER